MKWNLFIRIACACAAALSCSTALFSDYYMDGQTYTESCGKFSVYGDFLYWRVNQDEMQYAARFPDVDSNLISFFEGMGETTQKISVIDPHFSFEPGFRLGLGYEASEADWDVQLFWTCLHEQQHSRVRDTDAIFPLTVPASAIFDVFCNEAKSHWHFHFDALDLQLGKTCNFCGCFTLRPHIGLKGAAIRQKQDVTYLGFELGGVPIDVSNSKKNDFKGIGPSFGLDSAWTFLPDWRLMGGVSGALLCGKFDVDSSPVISILGDTLAFNIRNSKSQRLRPVVDAHIGVDWNTCLCDGFTISFGVFYEVQYWWNQWQVIASNLSSISTSGASPQGDLMMHGVTAHLGIAF